MYKKKIKTLAVVSAFALLLSGCGANKEITSEQGMPESENNVIYGIVTDITDSKIAITVGEISEVDMSNMNKDDNMASGGDSSMGEPPEKPDGEAPNGEAPEMPDGEAPNGEAPENGNKQKMTLYEFTEGEETKEISIDSETVVKEGTEENEEEKEVSDIEAGDVIEITLDSNNVADEVIIRNDVMNGNMKDGVGGPNGSGMPGAGDMSQGNSDSDNNGNAVETINSSVTLSEKGYASSSEDENALRIEGSADVNLSDITINKTADSSSSENSDFYGLNAGILVRDSSTAALSDITVNTDGKGANGVFCYGEGTTLNISDSTITTSKDNSGGIETAGGGTTNATNLTIKTSGNSSAAIRSDRGGGTVKVSKGYYETNGIGSPAVYSTANISVEDAELVSNASEAVVVEGMNSVSLNNCNVTGNMQTNGNDEICNVMIYQSMSGDAEVGESNFTMNGGKMTSLAGDMFYVTNTDCSIDLSGVEFEYSDGYFLRVSGNSNERGWGKEGANGGTCTCNMTDQIFEGEILVDDISSLDMVMSGTSAFTGMINNEGEAGEVSVTLEDDATWTLTGDSYVSEFNGDISKVDLNGYKLYVAGESIE